METQGPDGTRVRLAGPTDRYPHDVLGGIPGFARLEVVHRRCTACPPETATVTLPDTRVFEDTAPRLWDIDGDARPEVVTVESDLSLGARLVVYSLTDGPLRLIAASPFIGTRFRWLAPVGAADLDGDGRIELAYVDRPHLARTLVILRYADGALVPVAALPGLTNHRIGDTRIAGGLRTCAGRADLVVASADWRRWMAVGWTGTGFAAVEAGAYAPAPPPCP